MARPFSKIPWMEAMLGCPLKMTEGQLWNEHYPGDPNDVIARGANLEHNPWFQLYLEFLRRLQERLGDRFAVTTNTLLRGTSDLAAAVMGVQEAAMGWIDDPALMARLMRVCTDALLMVLMAQGIGPGDAVICPSFTFCATGEVVALHCTYDPATRGGHAPDGRRVKAALHWVSAAQAADAEVRLYENLFTKENPDATGPGEDFTASIAPNSLEVLTGCKVEPGLAGARRAEAYYYLGLRRKTIAGGKGKAVDYFRNSLESDAPTSHARRLARYELFGE